MDTLQPLKNSSAMGVVASAMVLKKTVKPVVGF
jgi:hypothetical protein